MIGEKYERKSMSYIKSIQKNFERIFMNILQKKRRKK